MNNPTLYHLLIKNVMAALGKAAQTSDYVNLEFDMQNNTLRVECIKREAPDDEEPTIVQTISI